MTVWETWTAHAGGCQDEHLWLVITARLWALYG
jgi:hypothetical protein